MSEFCNGCRPGGGGVSDRAFREVTALATSYRRERDELRALARKVAEHFTDTDAPLGIEARKLIEAATAAKVAR